MDAAPPYGVPWHDLRNRGFVHVRGFLSADDLQEFRQDYARRRVLRRQNVNYDVPNVSDATVWRLEPKLAAACRAVQAAAGLVADMTTAGLYFAIEKGVNFPWHQDHESYFLFQQHTDHLNFYMPILKPDPAHSNLCVIPFDELQRRIPERTFLRIAGCGASRFVSGEGTTHVDNDETGESFTLPVDLEELKAVPELWPGDLLLLRGDVIHRTQDARSERIAVSIHRTSSSRSIKRARLLAGSAAKRSMMQQNWSDYRAVLQCLQALGRDEVTPRELQAYCSSAAVACSAILRDDGINSPPTFARREESVK